ncbi:MAG: UdgX family uracil-DNA binding protein, partial [Hyphomicrobiales bacterium]|nr:UdgX family uracil-DNA binding protein [Hyphomicrobiales bacterium]
GRKRAMASGATDALAQLASEAKSCRACPLWANATQTIFGEGPADAKIVFVGEQPGDREDLAGHPFVGPAGALFDRALAAAGVDRSTVYVTNAVKHFKNEPRGKKRLHKRPNAAEVKVCRRWLIGELDLIAPQLIVALGATAALSLAQRPVAVMRLRGAAFDAAGRKVFVTVHPSSLLRLPEEVDRQAAFENFVDDLRAAAKLVGSSPAAANAAVG